MLPFIDIYEFGVKSIVCFLPFSNWQLNFLKYFCDTMINIWTSFCFNLILNWINNNKMKQWQSKSMYCLCYGKVDDPNHRFSEMNNFREKFDGRFFCSHSFFHHFFLTWEPFDSANRCTMRKSRPSKTFNDFMQTTFCIILQQKQKWRIIIFSNQTQFVLQFCQLNRFRGPSNQNFRS